ncbi:MAG: tetratricopeptide repeat protein [Granulosicoccus sp.]
MSQIDTFEAMLSRGQDSEMLRFTLGNAYYKEKRFKEAIVHLTSAVEQNPMYSSAWKVLGRALTDDEQYQSALVTFQSGLLAAQNNGDKQVEKEIGVFMKRAQRLLDSSD